jgi:hypothetical protein
MGSVTMSAKAEQQKRMQALQILSNPITGPHVNFALLVRKIYAGLGLGDEDQIINAIPMIPAPPPGMLPPGQSGPQPGVASQPAMQNPEQQAQPGTMLPFGGNQ